MFMGMKPIVLALVLLTGLTGSAVANCYADYKAKQDNPLRLHYGVAQVSACNKSTAQSELAGRLSAQGWSLLQVMSVFGAEGLEQRKESAGQYYLRF
jgi:hypothetical protein